MEESFIFPCGACQETEFISKKAFFTHIKTHDNQNQKEKLKCWCEAEFDSFKNFQKHVSNHVNKGNYFLKIFLLDQIFI